MNKPIKKASNLAALTLSLAAACGGTEVTNNYIYGPNGERIGDSSGESCRDSPLRGKYLIQIGTCDISTKQPLADDCTGQLHDKDSPEPYMDFTYSGLTFEGGFVNKFGEYVDGSITLVRPESECVIRNNPDLYFKILAGENMVETRLENLMQVGTTPYPGHLQCRENYRQNSRYHCD